MRGLLPASAGPPASSRKRSEPVNFGYFIARSDSGCHKMKPTSLVQGNTSLTLDNFRKSHAGSGPAPARPLSLLFDKKIKLYFSLIMCKTQN